MKVEGGKEKRNSQLKGELKPTQHCSPILTLDSPPCTTPPSLGHTTISRSNYHYRAGIVIVCDLLPSCLEMVMTRGGAGNRARVTWDGATEMRTTGSHCAVAATTRTLYSKANILQLSKSICESQEQRRLGLLGLLEVALLELLGWINARRC